MSEKSNARFLMFKPSGKWKYEGRGILPHDFSKYDDFRALIIASNGGLCPGMSTDGSDYIIIVIPDEDHPTGWPLMLKPKPE